MKFRPVPSPPFLRRTVVCHRDAWLIPPPDDGNNGISYQGGGGLYLRDRSRDPWLLDLMRRRDVVAPAVFEGAVSCSEPALFCGVLKRHFGHFLAEAIGRLWALDELGTDVPLVYLTRELPEVSNWPLAQAFLSLTGVKNPMRVIREPTRFSRLWAAEDLMHPISGGVTGRRLKRWFAARLPSLEPVAGPDIYVTRSATDQDRGRVLGETAIEAGLEAEGYQVFRPETLPLADQVSAYAHARRIVTSESSALHLMSLVVRPGTPITVIRRRPIVQPGMDSAVRSFAPGQCRFLTAIQAFWANDEPAWATYGLAELDFPLMWQELERRGFIRQAKGKPIPDPAHIEAERLALTPLRTVRFDLEPGVDYALLPGQMRSPGAGLTAAG